MSNGRQPVFTPEDHEHFLEYGFVVVTEAVPEATIQAVLPALEKDGGDSRDSPQIRACATNRLIAAIGELFGKGLEPLSKTTGRDMVRAYEPDADWGDLPAHIDDAYPTIMPNGWAIGCFLFLTRVRSGGGAFVYYPGSPRRYRQLMEGNWQSAKDSVAVPANSGPGHEFLASPGDAILFHHLMGHRGSANRLDPEVTRHAILTRWRPRERIVPGLKAFSQMTTIEKANSARYVAHCGNRTLPSATPSSKRAKSVLRNGLPGLGRPTGMALLYHGGGAHILHCARGLPPGPGIIGHLFSRDLINWESLEDVAISDSNVCSLQLHQYGHDVILTTTTLMGIAQLFSSQDCIHWRQVSELGNCRTVTPWFTYHKYASQVAKGHTLFVVPQNRGSDIQCRWGEYWECADSWTEQTTSLRAPDGYEIDDVEVSARYSDSDCAIVADLSNESEGERPFYALTKDVAMPDTSLAKLPYCGNMQPRRIRVLHRAQHHWMVGFLDRRDEEDRLLWGAIDWSNNAPVLLHLDTPEKLDQARAIVGLL